MTRKEFWVAEPKYENKLDEIIDYYEKRGQNIIKYPTNTENKQKDIEVEISRDYKKVGTHLDWEIVKA